MQEAETMGSESVTTVRFTSPLDEPKLNWETARPAREILARIESNERIASELLFDFSALRKIYANGIVPLVSWVDAIRTRRPELVVRVIPPTDAATADLGKRQNWFAALDPITFPAGTDGPRRVSLHRFRDADELNSLLDRTREMAIQSLRFEEGALKAFVWALNEVAGNVLDHAEAPGWFNVETHAKTRQLVITVCDAGVGILATIRRSHPEALNDVEALRLAVRKGVTSNPESGQGNGLWGSVSIVRSVRGSFHLASGRADLRVFHEEERLVERFEPLDVPIRGTLVHMQIPSDRPINVSEIFGGYVPAGVAELKYMDVAGDLAFRLRDHGSNFGNRPTGDRIRTRIENLLTEEPGCRLRVLMDGIEIVSSSFADELFGKLVARLGVLAFSRRISIEGANPVVTGIIENTVQQRIAQTFDERNGTKNGKNVGS